MKISEFQNKYSILILSFERTTGKKAIYHNKITGYFKYWIRQKIKYKTLICNDLNCPKFGQEFPSKKSLASHKIWHKTGYRKRHSGENSHMHDKHRSEETKKKIRESYNKPEVKAKHSKSMTETWNKLGYRERLSGENNPIFGRRGKECSAFKEDVGYHAIHIRVKKRKTKPKNCELCGLSEFNEKLGRLELSDKTGLCLDDDDNFQYAHISCHKKYDKENKIVHIKLP